MAEIQVVTHNLLRTLNEAQWREDINLYKSQAEVILFPEAWRVPGDILGPAWYFFRSEAQQRQADAMAWRKDKFIVQDKGINVLYREPSRTRYYYWSRLKHQTTGKVITYVEVHLPPRAMYTAHPEMYDEGMDNLEAFYRARKTPMIMGGDWNKTNAGGFPNRTNANYIGSRIDGFVYSPDMKVGEKRVFGNDETNTDHPIVMCTIDTNSIKDQPDQPADDNDAVKTIQMRVVTSNIKVSMPQPQVREDANWIIDNFHPNLWFTQESQRHHATLKSLPGYGFWAPDGKNIGQTSKTLLWLQEDFMFKGGRSFKLNWDPPDRAQWKDLALWMNMVHLQPRKAKQLDVYGFTMHTYTQVQQGGMPKDPDSAIQKAATAAYKRIAEIIESYANREHSVVFWGGDLNVNWTQDAGRSKLFPNHIFTSHGMTAIYDELDERATSVDIIGSHKNTQKKCKAKNIRHSPRSVNSDHRFMLGVYEIKGVKRDDNAGGETPSVPGEEPEAPSSPGQKFEPDLGHNEEIDHSDCCGGTQSP